MANLLTRSLVSFLAALIFVLALPAQADGTGFFLAGGLNYNALDDTFDKDNFSPPEDLESAYDDSSQGFNLGGGWRFNKWLAVDAAYWDFGEFRSDRDPISGEKDDLDATIITLGGIASVPLWIFDIYARGGAAFWDLEGGRFDEDGTDLYYGVGAAVNIFGSLDIYLEAVRFDLESDINSIGAGLRFTF
ncbi:MAG: outer membrane beta-barrel protein [Halioglobus sp.]